MPQHQSNPRSQPAAVRSRTPSAGELLDAARKLDWPTLDAMISALPPDDRNDRIQWLVTEIRQQGYTACRRNEKSRIQRRDAFVAGFRQYLDGAGHKALADEWRTDDPSVAATEWAYQTILQTVQTHALPPDRHAWSTLRHMERRLAWVEEAVQNWRPKEGQPIEPATVKVRLPDGSSVNPDGYAGAINEAATATLKMLARAHSWCGGNEQIRLPGLVASESGDEAAVDNTQGLGLAWQMLERSDEHLRFFGGEARLAHREVNDQANSRVGVTVAEFEFEGDAVVVDRIAHDRQQAVLMRGWNQLLWESTIEQVISNAPPRPLPPDGYISDVEAHAVIAMSHALCKPIVTLTDDYAGLRLVEWVRGYAALARFASAKVAAKLGEYPCRFERDELVAYLVERGLTAAKAATFVQNLIFRKNDTDLFDSPVLQDVNGQLWLCAHVAKMVHPHAVVFSKLASLQGSFAWRGPAFEKTIHELFDSKNIPARHIHTKVAGEELEVDCVVFWDGVLFVFECKNVSLSGKTNESAYRFYQTMEKAIAQVTRKRDLLNANPSILEAAFGKPLQITRSVRVVLNAMPFSTGKLQDDLFIYDASALDRFFESRHLRVTMPAQVGTAKILRRHGVKSLWSSELPCATDLIAEMSEPLQVKSIAHEYQWTNVQFPIAHAAGITTWRVHRQPQGLEATLTAIGLDGAGAVAEVHSIRQEFSDQVRKLQTKLDNS